LKICPILTTNFCWVLDRPPGRSTTCRFYFVLWGSSTSSINIFYRFWIYVITFLVLLNILISMYKYKSPMVQITCDHWYFHCSFNDRLPIQSIVPWIDLFDWVWVIKLIDCHTSAIDQKGAKFYLERILTWNLGLNFFFTTFIFFFL